MASPPRSVSLAAGPPPTHDRHVSIPPAGTRTGRHGKSYPAQMPPPLAWRWRAVTLTRRLCRELGYSPRAAQRELARRGYRRSLGTVCYDLSRPLPRGQRARREADPRRPSGRLTHAGHPAG